MSEITSIEEIKNRWLEKCVKFNQRLKNKDYKDLQYINKLISDELDNNTINTRLERYRNIKIVDESLNKKRQEFNKRKNKPRKRVDLSKLGNRIYFKCFEEEIQDNPYYNQKVVWCNACNRTHRVNSNIAWDHFVRPLPIKCEVSEDHCWKYTGQKKKFAIEMFEGTEDSVSILLTECYVVECIICNKKGLKELSFITDRNIDITTVQSKELNGYVQLIKNLGFRKLSELGDNKYKSLNKMNVIRIPKFDRKIREIQNIEDYVAISLF